ncbi:helix-turn-helix transcriptional regulator [Deinococcus sp.]|uniref:helix-turn-helix domain-containing protein n=1 Tax=Deinococcus sp. TaxID=47478 RepID=UPI0025D7A2A2|nr:helix-turn-helix transcriptional regulator [Deinococcus sp.]
MDVNERIREQVKQEMKRRGLSQIELARQLGITPPALSQVLSGKRGTMPGSLMDVLHALGLTLEAVPQQPGQGTP